MVSDLQTAAAVTSLGATAAQAIYNVWLTTRAWPGITWKALSERAGQRATVSLLRAQEHELAAQRWRRMADPLAWLTAVLAAISGLAVVASNESLATAFAIATAIAAATNAALSPAETARKHRGAALAYERICRKLEDFQLFDLKEADTPVPDEDLTRLREVFRKFDEEANAIAEASPPINFAHPPAPTRVDLSLAAVPVVPQTKAPGKKRRTKAPPRTESERPTSPDEASSTHPAATAL